jgi:hypothetical protein
VGNPLDSLFLNQELLKGSDEKKLPLIRHFSMNNESKIENGAKTGRAMSCNSVIQ